MRLFDTHCHFDFEPFADDFPAQLRTAKEQGVERFLIPSIGPTNWQRVRELSCHHREIYYSLGIHPYFLNLESNTDLTGLELALMERSSKCLAVGECGLDAMVDMDSKLQESILSAQVAMAQSSNLPLILHARKTHNRLIQILKQHKFKHGGILHGFSGSYQQAMQFVDLGFYIGVGGVITYPRANKTRQAISQLPEHSLVLETDAPDMPLNGYQGKPNHPKLLAKTLTCLAELKKTPKQTFASILWKNSNLALNICE